MRGTPIACVSLEYSDGSLVRTNAKNEFSAAWRWFLVDTLLPLSASRWSRNASTDRASMDSKVTGARPPASMNSIKRTRVSRYDTTVFCEHPFLEGR